MYGLLISNAYAQDAAAAAPNAFMSMLPIVMVFGIFYFLMIRPQQKKAQQEREYLSKLEKGVEVYTKSGIIGTITAITEKIVTIEVEGGTKLKMLRSYIGGPVNSVVGQKQPASNTKAKTKAKA